MTRDLISLSDLPDGVLDALVANAVSYSRRTEPPAQVLDRAIVGIYFAKTSTRTRTSFSAGAIRLGGQIIAYGPGDMQTNTGETWRDTGRILGTMLDVLVARTAADESELYELASDSRMPVVNAMTRQEHPTQAIADLATIAAHRGGLDGVRIGYFGEGNNTASALALGVARVPNASLTLCTPEGYGVDAERLRAARAEGSQRGATIREQHDPMVDDELDYIYTTRWETTGTTKADPKWKEFFRPFAVDARLMERHPRAMVLHDLPAHRGQEITAEVLDGSGCLAFTQAHFKLFAAMSVLAWAVEGRDD